MGKFRDLFTANDMTVGTPWKSIARFAFPMLIGNFAQQLYNTVDAVVVGRSKWGYTALASVGNALPILNLLLALFVGIATGAGILVAQFFGAKDRKSLEKTIGNCIFISFAAGLFSPEYCEDWGTLSPHCYSLSSAQHSMWPETSFWLKKWESQELRSQQ